MSLKNNTLSPDNHSHTVASMFSQISRWYDFLNHFLSLGLDFYWRAKLVEATYPHYSGHILDLAAGTLDVGRAIANKLPQTNVIALDLSHSMLVRGRKKINKAPLLPLCADAKRIPMADECINCVTIAFGIRNILPRFLAFKEILRVLIPGGQLCILEFGTGKKRIWGGVYNYYLSRILPWLGHIISGNKIAYRYLAKTIIDFPSAKELKNELQEVGFINVNYKELSSGIVALHTAQKKLS